MDNLTIEETKLILKEYNRIIQQQYRAKNPDYYKKLYKKHKERNETETEKK
jgi:hypothetical protein